MQINVVPLTTPYHLLVVDDDKRLRELISKYLKENGFIVSTSANAAEARVYLTQEKIDLIILDIMMPGETGIEFAQKLRASQSFLPIIMLTAKDQVLDRVEGLNNGADDYLTKPFEPIELLARIRANLRRVAPIAPPKAETLSFGGYCFHVENGLLRKDGEPVFLTSTELILLKTLAQMPRHPVSREELAQRMGHRVSERTVDVQITRLRRKIGDDPRQPRILQTVRHIGYALYPD